MKKPWHVVALLIFSIVNLTLVSNAHAGFLFIGDADNLSDFAVKSGELNTISQQFDAPEANTQEETNLISEGYITHCYSLFRQNMESECKSEGFNSLKFSIHSEYNVPTNGNAYASCKVEFRCLKILYVKQSIKR